MKKNSLLGYLGTAALFTAAFFLYFVPPPAFGVVTTTSVIGLAFPNATTLGDALIPFILPIIIMGFFVWLTRATGMVGETGSLVLKLGLFVGCLLGMLSLTTSAPVQITIGFAMVPAVYLVTYLWKKV